jgi:hypothetical protein
MTMVRGGAGQWSEEHHLFMEVPVRSVGVAPDSANAVLLHEIDPAPSDPLAPFSYTLLDLVKTNPVDKRQNTQADPLTTIFTPQGDRAAVLLRDDSQGVRAVDMVDLRTFIVDGVQLGSPPEGGGYVQSTEKIFISQEHPSGRITFIDSDGHLQTITGYRLNDSVKD